MSIPDSDITAQELIKSQRETITALQQTITSLHAQISDLKAKQYNGWGTTFIPNTVTVPSVPYMPSYPSITCASGTIGVAIPAKPSYHTASGTALQAKG